MTFQLEALRDKPVALYMCDDSSPLQDYSGFNRTATTSAAANQNAGLVKGTTYAPLLTSALTATFACPVFIQGQESKPFTIECALFPTFASSTPTFGPQQVLSHSGQFDGISISGTVVSFSTQYLTTGSATVSYDLQTRRNVLVTGVHTSDKNMLFIDGQLVGTATITEEQKADSYVATDGNLYSGTTTSTQQFAIGAVGFYAAALSPDRVARHAAVAKDFTEFDDAVSAVGGITLNTTKTAYNLFADYQWESEEDWRSAILENVTVVDGMLVPQFNGSVSMPGRWTDTVNLTTDVTSVQGLNLYWEGSGVTIEVSVNGTTWETVSKGVAATTTIPAGYNPTGKFLMIRVTFAGGVTDDTAYLDNLSVIGYKSATNNFSGRATTIASTATPLMDRPTMEYNEVWGTKIPSSGGSLTIAADASPEAFNPQTVVAWVRRMPGASPVTSLTGTVYRNGAASSWPTVQGVWTMVTWVAAAPITGTISFNGAVQIGQVALFENALSAAEVAALYSAQVRTNSFRASDASVIAVTQSAEAASIYAHEWSIVGAE